jgi:hypothetical protein
VKRSWIPVAVLAGAVLAPGLRAVTVNTPAGSGLDVFERDDLGSPDALRFDLVPQSGGQNLDLYVLTEDLRVLDPTHQAIHQSGAERVCLELRLHRLRCAAERIAAAPGRGGCRERSGGGGLRSGVRDPAGGLRRDRSRQRQGPEAVKAHLPARPGKRRPSPISRPRECLLRPPVPILPALRRRRRSSPSPPGRARPLPRIVSQELRRAASGPRRRRRSGRRAVRPSSPG